MRIAGPRVEIDRRCRQYARVASRVFYVNAHRRRWNVCPGIRVRTFLLDVELNFDFDRRAAIIECDQALNELNIYRYLFRTGLRLEHLFRDRSARVAFRPVFVDARK